MNPDEAWIGKVLFVGIVGLSIWAIKALLTAKSEGARRTRLVLGGAAALGIAAMLFALGGPVVFAVELVILGAIIWVFKGFKKGSTSPKQKPPHPSQSNEAEEDATEFTEVKDTAPQRKTVISCPNCDGRLRVLAGKYIDVTCPHCKTVFRTHT
jgi:hypothetical protein